MPRLNSACAAVVAAAFALIFSFSVAAQDDPVVAKVEGHEIRRSEMVRAFSSLPQKMQQTGLEAIYPQLLERLIQQQLLILEGRKNNLENSPKVKSRLKRLEDRLIGEVYLNQLIEPSITPGVLHKRYQEFLDRNPAVEEVRARHILLKTEIDAKNVIGHIDAGKAFDMAAKEYSTGPSAASGGDLGYFRRGDMVKPFSDVAFAMQAGMVSPLPVKTRFGWHVIKVEDRRTVIPPSFEEIRPRILRDATQAIAVGIMRQLVADAKVERFGLNGKPLSAPLRSK